MLSLGNGVPILGNDTCWVLILMYPRNKYVKYDAL